MINKYILRDKLASLLHSTIYRIPKLFRRAEYDDTVSVLNLETGEWKKEACSSVFDETERYLGPLPGTKEYYKELTQAAETAKRNQKIANGAILVGVLTVLSVAAVFGVMFAVKAANKKPLEKVASFAAKVIESRLNSGRAL